MRFPLEEGVDYILTRGYDTPSHQNTDFYALDFTQPGCDGWDDPIYAVAPGVVSNVSTSTTGWGNRVEIDHGNGYVSRYAHLNQIHVATGTEVTNYNTIIGTMGNSGNVYGAVCAEHPGTHLHFALLLNGDPVIPEPLAGLTGFPTGDRPFSTNGNPVANDGSFTVPVFNSDGVIGRLADGSYNQQIINAYNNTTINGQQFDFGEAWSWGEDAAGNPMPNTVVQRGNWLVQSFFKASSGRVHDHSMIVYNPERNEAFAVIEGFWGLAVEHELWNILDAPSSNEFGHGSGVVVQYYGPGGTTGFSRLEWTEGTGIFTARDGGGSVIPLNNSIVQNSSSDPYQVSNPGKVRISLLPAGGSDELPFFLGYTYDLKATNLATGQETAFQYAAIQGDTLDIAAFVDTSGSGNGSGSGSGAVSIYQWWTIPTSGVQNIPYDFTVKLKNIESEPVTYESIRLRAYGPTIESWEWNNVTVAGDAFYEQTVNHAFADSDYYTFKVFVTKDGESWQVGAIAPEVQEKVFQVLPGNPTTTYNPDLLEVLSVTMSPSQVPIQYDSTYVSATVRSTSGATTQQIVRFELELMGQRFTMFGHTPVTLAPYDTVTFSALMDPMYNLGSHKLYVSAHDGFDYQDIDGAANPRNFTVFQPWGIDSCAVSAITLCDAAGDSIAREHTPGTQVYVRVELDHLEDDGQQVTLPDFRVRLYNSYGDWYQTFSPFGEALQFSQDTVWMSQVHTLPTNVGRYEVRVLSQGEKLSTLPGTQHPYTVTVANPQPVQLTTVTDTAALFDGYGDRVQVTQGGLDEAVTVEGRVRLNAYTTGVIFSHWNEPRNQPILELGMTPSKVYCLIGNENDKVEFPMTLELGRWYHIAATYQRRAGGIKLYVDGSHVATYNEYLGDYGTFGGVNSWYFGGNDGDMYYYNRVVLDGYLDEVRVWNHVRSQSQINATKDGELGPQYYTTADSGLVGYWQFNSDFADLSTYQRGGGPRGNTILATVTDSMAAPAATCADCDTMIIYADAADVVVQDGNYGYERSWSYHHDLQSGVVEPVDANISNIGVEQFDGPAWGSIRRYALPFDTSVLPDSIEVVAADLNLHVFDYRNSQGQSHFLGLTSGSYQLPVIDDDYDQLGAVSNPTEGAERLYFAPTDFALHLDSLVSMQLSDTGCSWIDVQDMTTFALRQGDDILNRRVDEYAGVWGRGSYVRVASGDHADLAKRPFLRVVYRTVQTEPAFSDPVVYDTLTVIDTVVTKLYTNKDSFYGTSYYQSGKPDYEYLWTGGWGDRYYAFVEWDLTGAPLNDVLSVKACFTVAAVPTNDPRHKLLRIRSAWDEHSVSRWNYPSYTISGSIDMPSTNAASVDDVEKVDISQIYSDWMNGVYANHGLMMKPYSTYNTSTYYYSSDCADSTKWPYLEVKHLTSRDTIIAITDTDTTTAADLDTITTRFWIDPSDAVLSSYAGNWSGARTGSNLSVRSVSYDYWENNYNGFNYILRKVLLPVNTSLLPDDATMLSARIGIKPRVLYTSDNDGRDYLALVESSVSDPVQPLASEWNQFGSDVGANTLDISSDLQAHQYAFFELNATGLSWINPLGYSQFGVRGGHDLENHVITGDNYAYCYMADHSDSTNWPFLEVTYTTSHAMAKRGTSGATDVALVPSEYRLHQNYPNPFNPTTTIAFDLPIDAHVKVVIYNLLGQEVARPLDERRKAGYHHVQWDARQMASGMYFYRFSTPSFHEVKKMLLVR